MLVLQGQAVEGGGLPYQLWCDPVRRLVLSTELSPLEAGVLKEIVPDLDTLLNQPVMAAPESPGEAGQQRLAFTLVELCQRQTLPVVLSIPDLQWAGASLELLRRFLRFIDPLPVLVIGNYRDDERPSLPDELPLMQVIKLNRLQLVKLPS